MRELDAYASELTYEEYVVEAGKLKTAGFDVVIYPKRPGVTYVRAYNPHNKLYRLLTLKEYSILKNSGQWIKGVDRLYGAKKTSKKDLEDNRASVRLDKLRKLLIQLKQDGVTNYDEARAALNKISDLVFQV